MKGNENLTLTSPSDFGGHFPIFCSVYQQNKIYITKDMIVYFASKGGTKYVYSNADTPIVDICCDSGSCLIVLSNGDLMMSKNSEFFSFIGSFECTRGISIRNGSISFIDGRSNIHLMNPNRHQIYTFDDVCLVSSQLTQSHLFCITSFGVVFYSEQKNLKFSSFSTQKVFRTILTTPKCAIIQDQTGDIYYVNDDNVSQLVSVSAPPDFNIVSCCLFGSILSVLDRRGRIAFCNISQKNLILTIDSMIPTITWICNEQKIMGFNGSKPVFVPNCSCYRKWQFLLLAKASFVFESEAIPILALTSDHCYLGGTFQRREPIDNLLNYVKDPKYQIITSPSTSIQIFYTNNNKIIGVDSSFEETFSQNFIKGDIVKTSDSLQCQFVGIYENHVWISPFGNRLAFAVMDVKSLTIVERVGHLLKRYYVDGEYSTVDVTPCFCEQFGYFVGDYYWIQGHGYCEFTGVFSGRLVFLDFSLMSHFSIKPFFFEHVGSFYSKYFSRKVLVENGKFIDISINCSRKLFCCGDRVDTSEGEATVMGFLGNLIYIQTDEMMIGSKISIPMSPLSLTLIRTLKPNIYRSFITNNNEKTLINVSARTQVRGFMAGDHVLCHNTRMKIIGVNNGVLFAKNYSTSEISLMKEDCTLLYRSGLLGGNLCESYEVGSPALGMNSLIPDDLVTFSQQGQFVFRGMSTNGPVFESETSQESFLMSFTGLLIDSSYRIDERRAILKNNQK